MSATLAFNGLKQSCVFNVAEITSLNFLNIFQKFYKTNFQYKHVPETPLSSSFLWFPATKIRLWRGCDLSFLIIVTKVQLLRNFQGIFCRQVDSTAPHCYDCPTL